VAGSNCGWVLKISISFFFITSGGGGTRLRMTGYDGFIRDVCGRGRSNESVPYLGHLMHYKCVCSGFIVFHDTTTGGRAGHG